MSTTNNTNVRAAFCMQCHAVIMPGEGIAVAVKSDGNKSRYVCHECNAHYNDINYSAHATAAARGKQSAHGTTYAVELELASVDATTRAELAKVGFIATKDCTTDVEFKSAPRGNFCNAKTWNTLECLLRDGHAAITPNEGTHVHIGNGTVNPNGTITPGMINAQTMACLRQYYSAVFAPLYDAMNQRQVATVRLFGRFFNDYAKCDASVWAGGRKYSAINTCHSNTVEWRLTKFRTAEQFRAVLAFEKAATECIVTNFMAYANNYTPREKLEHKAQVTAKKLVRLFEKHAANAPEWTDASGVSSRVTNPYHLRMTL